MKGTMMSDGDAATANDTKSVDSSLSEEKTPAQLAYEATGYSPMWQFIENLEGSRKFWQKVADAVRAPLLAEIERLKRFAKECDWCCKPAIELDQTSKMAYCEHHWAKHQKRLKEDSNVTPHNS